MDNLKRYRRWLSANAVSRTVQAFLPTFLDGDASKYRVVVDDSMQPRTDGKTIWVSLIPDALEYEPKDWLVLLQAAAAHEAQHINSSNFADIEEIRNCFGQFFAQNYGFDKSVGANIAQEALNIVEDGRIEAIAVNRRPGMYVPFAFMNRIVRDGTAITERAKKPEGEYVDFWNNVLSYTVTGLYAPGVNVYGNSEMESMFLLIRGYIDDGVAAYSSADCRGIVNEMLEELAPYLAKLIKASPDLEQSLTEKAAENEYQGNNETEFGIPSSGSTAGGSQAAPGGSRLRAPSPVQESNGKPGKAPGRKGKKGKQKGKQEGKQEDSAPKSQAGESAHCDNGAAVGGGVAQPDQENPLGFTSAIDTAPPLPQEKLDELSNLYTRELQASNKKEETPKGNGTELTPADIDSIRGIYSSDTSEVTVRRLYVKGRDPLPTELMLQARRLAQDVLRKSEERSRGQKGLRRGYLDPNALWKTGLGESNIFQRRRIKDVSRPVWSVLVDNSGSMDSKVSEDITKYALARSGAAVLEMACCGAGVPIKIALFAQRGSCVQHTILRDFDDRAKVSWSWNSITEHGPGGCNEDSIHIRIATTELLRRPERKKVLLVLSDGKPSAYASHASAETEVREAVREARRKGIVVIPIMYGDMEFLSNNRTAYERMYERSIVACQPKDIITKLAQLLLAVQ